MSLWLAAEWVGGYVIIMTNRQGWAWQAGAWAAAAVALRRVGSPWIGSVISTSHPDAIIFNVVCLQNKY